MTSHSVKPKKTPQRLAVSMFLQDNKTHPTAADVYKAASESCSTISPATVYNTLEVMKNRGMIREVCIDTKKKRFDPDLSPHHHFICVECKEIRDVRRHFDLSIDDPEWKGFEITESSVQFFGLCPTCKEKLKG